MDTDDLRCELENKMVQDGVDERSLVFKASRGFYGKRITNGETVIFCIVREYGVQRDICYGFFTPEAIGEIVRDYKYRAHIVIPLKDGVERNKLPASAKEIEAE